MTLKRKNQKAAKANKADYPTKEALQKDREKTNSIITKLGGIPARAPKPSKKKYTQP